MRQPAVKLCQFRIKGYRSCKNAAFSPRHDLSVLIGPNGSGKTNLLSALMLLSSAQSRRYRASDDEVNRYHCDVEAEFSYQERRVLYKAKFFYVFADKNKEEVLQADEYWNFKEYTNVDEWINLPYEDFRRRYRVSVGSDGGKNKYSLTMLFHFANRHRRTNFRWPAFRRKFLRIMPVIEAVAEYRSKITYYSASQFTDPSQCPTFFEVDEDGDLQAVTSRSAHLRFLYDLYSLKKSDSELYEYYISLVSATSGVGLINSVDWSEVKALIPGIDVQVGGRLKKTNRVRRLIIPTVKIKNNPLSFSQLSEGTFRTLALLFYIVTDKRDLLLIEEPEVCVHHGLVTSIVEVIKQFAKTKQIIFSTHSETILNHLAPEDVFVVSNRGQVGTKVRPVSRVLSSTRFAALKSYLETTGNLGDYWKESGFEQ